MTEEKYDSSIDTAMHVARVGQLLGEVTGLLTSKANVHDASKFEDPEKPVFDEVTPKLKALTYGSPEYKEQLANMGVALTHHYASNSHHPEHFANGIADMNLLQLLEMLADWKAATERHADGNMAKSLVINARRFNMNLPLANLLFRTAVALGWATTSDIADAFDAQVKSVMEGAKPS